MISQDINRWVFQIPLEDVQNENADVASSCQCFLCGKTIKGTHVLVHLLTNGNLVSTAEPFEESQGFFSVGPECKKRLPNNFYWKP